MRILISELSGAGYFYRTGWANAFRKLGHIVSFTKLSSKPIYDIFDEFIPNLFIGTTWELTESIVKCCQQYQCKVLLQAPDWGDFTSQIDTSIDTVQIATDEEKDSVKRAVEVLGGLDLFHYYTQNSMEVTHNHWKTLNCRIWGVPMACDSVVYYPSELDDNLKCQIAFVGGYWPYKSKYLNEFILKACEKGYRVKIFGNRTWPVSQYMGPISVENERKLYSSAICSPAIYEPLSPKYGKDVSERIYKTTGCKGFCISQYIESAAQELYPQGVVFIESPDEFFLKLDYFLTHENERQEITQLGYEHTIRNHTYFHRILEMFKILGMDKEILKTERHINKVTQ